MEFKDYKEMDRDELKKLYQNLCEINRNVEYDYKDKKSELEKLYKEKERLLETKKQIEYLNNSNSMKLDKNLSAIVTLLSTGALGYCLHLSRNFSNSPEEVIALAISSLTLFGAGMIDYTLISSYLYDKKLIKENNLSELEPKINNINTQIGNTSQHIATDEKILKKCRTNLPLLKDRLIEVSKKSSF